PTEAHEIVTQGRRQIAHRTVGIDTQSAMALGEFCAVSAMNKRDMRHLRYIPAHRVVDDGLPCGIGQMIVATNDMSHTHIVIIDNNCVHVGGRSIGTQDDEIIEIFVREAYVTLYRI